MANIFLVSHILLLFHSFKGSQNKSAKYEKLGKYWSYCTRNRKITNAYSKDNLPKTKLNEKIKDGAKVINHDEYFDIGTHWIALYVVNNNVTYFDSSEVEHIPKEI